MEKEYKAVLIADLPRLHRLHQELILALGPDRIVASDSPKDTFALLRREEPEVLIVQPDFLREHGVSLSDLAKHRKSRKYKLIALFPDRPDPTDLADLCPDAEYCGEWDGFKIAAGIPELCKHPYVYRRKPLEQRTETQIRAILTECGFRTRGQGFERMIRALAMQYLDPDLHYYGGAQKIYAALAERDQTTPRIVERSVLRFLTSSWTPQTREKLFAALDIPDHYEPAVNFGDFTLLFTTYYARKYGEAKIYLTKPKRTYRSAD